MHAAMWACSLGYLGIVLFEVLAEQFFFPGLPETNETCMGSWEQ